MNEKDRIIREFISDYAYRKEWRGFHKDLVKPIFTNADARKFLNSRKPGKKGLGPDNFIDRMRNENIAKTIKNGQHMLTKKGNDEA